MTAPAARSVPPTLTAIARARLDTCHPDIIRVVVAVANTFLIQVITGTRSREEQAAVFAAGRSRAQWPNSYHNQTPSLAVDLAPMVADPARPGRLTIDWNDLAGFQELADAMKHHAAAFGVPLEWGGDWKSFKDRPHFQLGKDHPDVAAWLATRQRRI
ncbi:MAG: M15 family metallopeptidase [Tagaea sp.]|nr:M15 family metallopeptidase [Tagaea sp.]